MIYIIRLRAYYTNTGRNGGLSNIRDLSRPCRVMQGESEKDMIRTKADALAFLKSHKEFSDQDWIEGEFWFRYDGVTEPECLRHDYTINHETEGIIGVMEKEAVVRPLGCMP